MWFSQAPRKNVHDGYAARHKGIGEQPAVTAPPDGLCAHHSRQPACRKFQQRIKPGAEGCGRHVIGIPTKTVFTPPGIRRVGSWLAASAELGKVTIRDAVKLQKIRELVGVEVRIPAGSRERADIGELLDAVGTEELQKRLRRMGRMTDGRNHTYTRTPSTSGGPWVR